MREFEDGPFSVRATDECRAVEVACRIEDKSRIWSASACAEGELVEHMLRPLAAAIARQFEDSPL